jgi:hypothetical protein
MALVPSPTTLQTIECYTTSIITGGAPLTDFHTGSIAYIPAHNCITEIEIQRRNATLLDPSGQNISVGIAGNMLTVSTNLLNSANWVGVLNINRLAPNVNTNLMILSSASNITSGSLYVVVKYKPITTGNRK